MKKSNQTIGLEQREAELRRLIKQSAITALPLYSDFTYAVKRWNEDQNSQFWSRTSIRCLCAAIEATLFTYRKMAEKMATVFDVSFTHAEIEILTEQRTKVDGNGVQTVKPKWLPFPDSLKESFRLFGKAVGTELTIDYGNVGFSALRQVFEIRNRLMHPKGPFDVEVRAADTVTADKAIKWFNDAHKHVITECEKHLGETILKMRHSPPEIPE